MAKKKEKKEERLPRRKGVFTYRGVPLEELKKMPLEKFADLLPARQRRKIRRNLTKSERRFLQKVRSGKKVRTHLRGMIVLPEMVGKEVEVHAGRDFVKISILPEMIGHYLGEFVGTRKRVKHGVAGIGATRSSKYIPLK